MKNFLINFFLLVFNAKFLEVYDRKKKKSEIFLHKKISNKTLITLFALVIHSALTVFCFNCWVFKTLETCALDCNDFNNLKILTYWCLGNLNLGHLPFFQSHFRGIKLQKSLCKFHEKIQLRLYLSKQNLIPIWYLLKNYRKVVPKKFLN